MDRDRRPHRDVEQARQLDAGSAASGTPIRLKLGQEDVKTKRFLNHLTRYHYLKRRLNKKADELLTGALNHERYANRKLDDPLLQEGANNIAWQRAAADRAQNPLKAIITSAVHAAGWARTPAQGARPRRHPCGTLGLWRTPQLGYDGTLDDAPRG